ncbi:MAG TPA: response regulator, partial [Candidatus Onthocola stercoravium]|nr:response regulator [Candidatus Onthocola stercoravium]
IMEFTLCTNILLDVPLFSFYNLLINKLFLVTLFTWFSLFTLYIISVAGVIKIHKKVTWKIITYYLIIVTLLVFLPIELVDENGVAYSTGIATYLLYGICVFYVLIWLIIIFKNKKKLRKKALPFIAFIICLIIMLVARALIPGLLLNSFSSAFATVLMYFTIENPDIKMIEQLNIAKETAEKANAAKTDFLSNMSHEIRTPLNAIVGFSNLLLDDESVPEKAKDEVRDIVMASDNLLEIVNGILDISKIEAGKLEIVDTEYTIKKVIDELVALSKGRLGDKPIEFKTNIDPSIPPVLYGDAGRIKQICVNILTNAIKYTKEGWIEFKVSSVVKDNICRLIISVEDTGIGIKEKNIDKLFNKFERLDLEDNVTIEGTGLGLAITKKLVDLMHGKIVVQSVFGKGSKFTVSIDQRIVENPTIKVDAEKITNKEIIVNNKKVLLVDDNKINLKVAERLLESYGIKTESVESGFACLDKIKAGEKYDLIMLDDMMPKMSGVETLKKLKEIKGFDTKVIALTANALTGMREKYLNDGFNDYLAKPINKEELNKIINKYLNND